MPYKRCSCKDPQPMSPLMDGTTFCSACSKVLHLGAYDPSYDKVDSYKERKDEVRFGILHLVDDADLVILITELLERRDKEVRLDLISAISP